MGCRLGYTTHALAVQMTMWRGSVERDLQTVKRKYGQHIQDGIMVLVALTDILVYTCRYHYFQHSQLQVKRSSSAHEQQP